jgi:predicted nucleic acid-binding protein
VIAYFDTSSIIPLIVAEPGSEGARRHWQSCERVVSARIVYAEGRAALAFAARLERIPRGALAAAVDRLDGIYDRLELIEISDRLVRDAGRLAEAHSLRGYDSVHLAAAALCRGASGEVLFVAGDEELCRAAEVIGLEVAQT